MLREQLLPQLRHPHRDARGRGYLRNGRSGFGPTARLLGSGLGGRMFGRLLSRFGRRRSGWLFGSFEIGLERRPGLDGRLGRRFDSGLDRRLGRRSRSVGRYLGRCLGRLRIYFERVLFFVEREFFWLGRLGLDLRFSWLGRRGLRFVGGVPINRRQMRAQVAGWNVVHDFYRVCGRRSFGGMQKSRRDKKHERENRDVPECGDENRREVSESRRILIAIMIR